MTVRMPDWLRIDVEPTQRMKELMTEAQRAMREYHRLELIEQRKAWRSLYEQISGRAYSEIEGVRPKALKH